jgi:tripartite ATP-independent transporter DctP family solute receptor
MPVDAQQITLHMGHNNQTDHPGHIAGLEFAQLVEEGTNGEIEVIVYPAEQLANVRAGAEGIQLGTIDLYYVDAGTLGNWHPQYAFVSLPFLFDDYDHAERSMDVIAEEITASMRRDFNVERLGWTPAGFRVMMSKGVAITSAEDLNGVKFRVPEIPLYVETFTRLGANPTPLPWGDVYSAIQTGVVDAVEGPAPAIRSAGFYEVATHVAPTYHIMTDLSLLMNLDRFESLSPEHQEVLREAGRQAFDVTFRQLIREADTEAFAAISANLETPESLDVESFRTAVSPVVEEFLSAAGPEVEGWVATIRAE